MPLTRAQFEALLQRLKDRQTESPTVDGKARLPLNTEGDRANFIRHVAALANNAEPSYLIVGVRDRTWAAVGLGADPDLLDPHKTQKRMNDALARCLDPKVSVHYQTHEVAGVAYGVVAVEGTEPPYVVSIESQRYGGERTCAKPAYICRGAVYWRHGANSVIANRQSDLLGIIRKNPSLTEIKAEPDEYLADHNYLDVDSDDYGRHSLSICLLEGYSITGTPPATSWVTFVFCPLNSGCSIRVPALHRKLRTGGKPGQRLGAGSRWFQGIPESVWEMLYRPRATAKELVGKWRPSGLEADAGIMQFLRVRPTGHIEFGITRPLFGEYHNRRFFAFVPLIGHLWQMTYLAQAIYRDVGYSGDTDILVNLIGTDGTILAGFAEGWPSPFEPVYPLEDKEHDIADDPNIRVSYKLRLADAADDEIKTMIGHIAADIGSYYGQDRPRCFDPDTEEFPVERYTDLCKWL